MEKSVATVGVNGFDAGGNDGVAGDREGQAVNDYAAQLVSLDVDALPERGGGEEYGVGREAELFEQRHFGSVALQEHREFKFAEQALINLVHLRIAGEEDEGATAGDFQQAFYAVRGLGYELRRARVGQVGRNIENYLTLIIEVRRHDRFAGVIESETLADVVEASAHG